MLLYRTANQKTLASDKYPTETQLDKTKHSHIDQKTLITWKKAENC